MVIKNIDVSDILVEKVEKCIGLIKKTIERGTSSESGTQEFLYHIPITKVNSTILPDKSDLLLPNIMQNHVSFKNVSWFVHSVPIYLKKKPDPKELGEYVSGTGGSPYILLYVEKIYEKESSDDEQFKMLLTTVLIHELMHAVLDLSNNKDYYINSSTKNHPISRPFALVHKHMDRKVPLEEYKDYEEWREEAYANALTLHLIEKSDKKELYKYASDFMIKQEVEYAVGASLSKIRRVYLQTGIYLKEKNLEVKDTDKRYSPQRYNWDSLRRDWVSYVKNIKDNDDPMPQLKELEDKIRKFVCRHKIVL